MKIPMIPTKGSHQWVVATALVSNSDDRVLRRVWVLSIKGLTHAQITNAVEKLRDKKWPIEDTPVKEGAQHGYRLDYERWVPIRDKVKQKLGIIPCQ